jgi:hypothetical protein
MQHKAMSLMSKKMAAAQALEGEFSTDGLAAMAGDDNLQMSLAKNLSEGIDEADFQRHREKIKSGPKKRKQGASMIDAGKKIPASKLDGLPIEAQMATETIIEGHKKPIPDAAQAEFPGLALRLAQVDAGFGRLGDESLFDEQEYNDDMAGAESEPEPDGPVIPPVLYEYDPEPEPVTLPFPQPDPVDAFVAETVTKYTDKLSVQPEPEPDGSEPDPAVDDFFEDVLSDDGSEDLEEEEEAADGFFEDDGDEPVDEEEQKYMAMLTPEVIEKMLANMRANGIIV